MVFLKFLFLAAILIGLVTSNIPPSGPKPPFQMRGGGYEAVQGYSDDQQLSLLPLMAEPRVTPCAWRVTPCGRPTHVRAWGDLH